MIADLLEQTPGVCFSHCSSSLQGPCAQAPPDLLVLRMLYHDAASGTGEGSHLRLSNCQLSSSCERVRAGTKCSFVKTEVRLMPMSNPTPLTCALLFPGTTHHCQLRHPWYVLHQQHDLHCFLVTQNITRCTMITTCCSTAWMRPKHGYLQRTTETITIVVHTWLYEQQLNSCVLLCHCRRAAQQNWGVSHMLG
jgi:hypothetical protein